MQTEHDAQFLDYSIKALVDNPNDVKIVRTVDEMGVLLTLTVNPADMGKIIGRMGNTAKAIRTLLRVVGMKNNARVNLKINEPAGGTRGGFGGGSNQMRAPMSDSAPEAPQGAASRAIDDALDDIRL